MNVSHCSEQVIVQTESLFQAQLVRQGQYIHFSVYVPTFPAYEMKIHVRARASVAFDTMTGISIVVLFLAAGFL